MKKLLIIGSLISSVVLGGANVSAHCEVPCGIYDDEARIEEIHEHVSTIEKAMKQIKDLSKADEKNHNQIVRWVTTKDDHAKEIQNVVNQYFMTQRIKPAKMDDEAAYKKYVHELTLLHNMLVSAMKTKQTIDTSHAKAIHENLEKFSNSYFGKTEAKKE